MIANLREILAQIEQFELQEAQRAEEERLEQQRLAEERWEKIVKERLLMESIRRKNVEKKFQQLRDTLNSVHDGQRANVAKEHEDMTQDGATASKAKEDALLSSQSIELSKIRDKISKRVAEREAEFNKEYSCRAAKECKIEQDYEEQLKLYWSEKKGAEDEVNAAMFQLRQRMDQSHHIWRKWKDAQLSSYRTKLQDEQSIREEFMYSARQLLKARNEGLENELAKRVVAERKWVREVILERERLLGAAEVAEMEGDADSLFATEERGAEDVGQAT